MARFVDWLLRRPALFTALALALTLSAAFGARHLRYVAEGRKLFLTTGGAVQRLEEYYANFGNDDKDCFIVIRADDVFAPAVRAGARELAEAAVTIDGIGQTFSVFDLLALKRDGIPAPLIPPGADTLSSTRMKEILAHPLVGGRLIAADRHVLVIVARLSTSDEQVAQFRTPVLRLDQLVRRYDRRPEFDAALTGIPPARLEIFDTFQREQLLFMNVSAAVGGVIAFLLFRNLFAIGIVAAAAILGMFWSVGSFGLLGRPINPINSVVPSIVLIIAYTDAVHLMHSIRRNRGAGQPHRDALRDTLLHVGPACALTSLTTAIGFGSLTLARNEAIQRFGLDAAIGVLLGFLAVILVTPLLSLTRFGNYVGESRSIEHVTRPPRGVRLITRHAGKIALGGLALTALLAWTATRLTPSTWLREGIPQGNDVARGIRWVDRHLGGVLTMPAVISWDSSLDVTSPAVLESVDAVRDVYDAEPMIGRPLSLHSLLALIPGDSPPAQKAALLPMIPAELRRRVVRPDLRRTVVTAALPDVGLHKQQPILDRVQARLARIAAEHPGIDIELTGSSIAIGGSVEMMITDLVRSLMMAALVIMVVMTLALRSIRLGLLSILPNTFPLAAAGAALVVAGYPLTVTGVIVFCISLGIAVDDTIHLLTRYRLERRLGADSRTATQRAIVKVGGALIITTVVLIAGFGVLLISRMPMLQLFGALCCVTLLAALIGDLVILPALLTWTARFATPRNEQTQ